MNSEEATKVIFDQVNKQIDAKLKPVTEIIVGLEYAIAIIFEHLHLRGVLTRQEALEALQSMQERSIDVAPPTALLVLKHISGMLEGMHENDPLVRRSLFQVLDKVPADTDANDPQE